jgi:hypothetical protein
MSFLELDSVEVNRKMRGDEMNEASNDNHIPADLLLGADAISKFLGITRRQAYRLTYDNVIPTFKAGGTVAARKSSLTRWMAAQEAA